MSAPRVTVYSKPGCHLCEQAEAIVAELCAELGVGWESVNIADDPELMRVYGEQIPVTFVDGRQHDYWRVDPARLRRVLTADDETAHPVSATPRRAGAMSRFRRGK